METLFQLWSTGHSMEAGRLIFAKLPIKKQPAWAVQILKLVLDKAGCQLPQTDRLLLCASNESVWIRGHDMFDELRRLTLQYDSKRRVVPATKFDELTYFVLSIAESVAKVVYNATNPSDEFDEDPACVVACLRGFVDHVWGDDEDFSRKAWDAIRHGINI